MSNLKHEAHEFVADGREEAVTKACQFFGVDDESELEISGFEPGAVYGLAARTVIVAVPKGAARSSPARSRDEGARRDSEPRGNSGRGAGRDSNRKRERNREDRSGEASARAREDREPRREREDREPRRDREDRGPRRERRPRGERESRGDSVPQGNQERTPKREDDRAAAAEGPSVGSATGELGEIGEFLLGTIERMGVGSFEISESKDGEMIVLQVKGAAAQALSSGHGRTVDALQLLVNQVAVRISPERQRVVIDVEGDADAREEFLGKLAERVAKRALQTGRPVALDPMNGRDRRLIHMALRDRDDVATMSEGEGRYRQVVVVPESSDEFEDAREQSEQFANNS